MYSIISGLKISWLISSSQSSSLTSKSLTSATRVRRMAPFWTRSMSTVIAWSQISPVFPFNECFWGFYLVLYRMNLSLFVFKADVGISSVFLKLRQNDFQVLQYIFQYFQIKKSITYMLLCFNISFKLSIYRQVLCVIFIHTAHMYAG